VNPDAPDPAAARGSSFADRLAPRPDRPAEAVQRIIHTGVPEAAIRGLRVEAITAAGAVVRCPFDPGGLRPGGTLSGPVMMSLADSAMYAAVLARLADGRMAVTSEMSIRFLRRPPPADLIARAEIVRFGRRQAVIEVRLFVEGDPAPVALVVGTYALPG